MERVDIQPHRHLKRPILIAVISCQRLHQYLMVKSSNFSFKFLFEAILFPSLTGEDFAILSGLVYCLCKSLHSLISLKEASAKMSRNSLPSMIFFDVLGTIVEWRCCIANELNAAARRALQDQVRYLSADVRARVSDMSASRWQEIAEEWHRSYMNFGDTFNTSKPFVSVDEYNRISLENILTKFLLRGLFNEDDLSDLTLAWHRLDSHSDSVPGLSLLNTKFLTSTLSNGNVKLLEDLQEHNSLPFTHITSAEHFGAYKPSPEVYDGAARRFGLKNSQCCLVAAHLEDLHAAKKSGFQTIYLERDLEEAWDSRDIARAREQRFVDLWVGVGGSGLIEVARYFGIENEL